MNARFNTAVGLVLCAANIAFGGPLSPDDERASFQLADESLVVELVAAEPAVISPVALAWDARGRMFVAEMIDYPVGPKAGQIRMIEDRDGDGRYEKATVFADGLAFPNGVLPWKDGLLVTAAPDILFLQDTNGDGRADERRVVLTGFAEGNQQLRVNGLIWGLDGWVYGANGRSDGEIGRPGEAKRISLRGHDFRFRPATGEFEVIGGRSQFGLGRDDWGNRFLSWNTIAVRHEAIPMRYLARHPRMNSVDGIQDLTPPGDKGEVFPLTRAPQTFNKESTSHFNALAGLTIYRGDALPERYRGNAFVGETLRNLVHRRVLEPMYAALEAKPIEQKREFLASTDPWFHPVNFANGPDGALYVVDFYREWVEHPGYVPEKMRGDIAWRTGAEHGRIWRVRSRGAKPKVASNLHLGRAPISELTRLLGHTNGWWRDAAQRVLVERDDTNAVPGLKKASIESTLPEARVQALETLQQFNALDDATLRSALGDRHARVREVAVRLGERNLRLSDNSLRRVVVALTDDADARVRLQVALSIGEYDRASRVPVLERLALRDDLDDLTARAIRSSMAERPWSLLERISGEYPTRAARYALVRDLAADVGAERNEADCRSLLKMLSAVSQETVAEAHLVVFTGFAGALDSPLEQIRNWGGDYAAIVKPMIRAARHTAREGAREPLYQICLEVLARAGAEDTNATIIELLSPSHRDFQQAGAVAAMTAVGDPLLFQRAFRAWPGLQIETRRRLLAGATRSARTMSVLVEALEQGTIVAAELDASVRQVLLRTKAPDLRIRIQKLFDPPSDRAAVIEKFSPALKLDGEAQRGAQHFSRLCLQCHNLQGRGQSVGPDLSAISSRSREALLIDILDPSHQVAPDFISYSLTTIGDDTLDGLIVTENASGVTVRRAGIADQTIPRAQIREVRASGRSLMPDGLESDLTTQDLADLITFLRRPDPKLLP